MDGVWIFRGDGSTFPAAVFSSRSKAEEWIARHRLEGTLTLYPIDEPVYEWAMAHGYFKPTREDQTQAKFIQRFTSASQEHYHYRSDETSG